MGVNLLVVDDSRTVRFFMEKAVRLAEIPGTELFFAENGKEALDLIAEHAIHLVFTDINMPVMNGIEMIERLEAAGRMKDLPVVVLSTEGSTARIAQLEARGVRAYIRKPFQPEQIRETIRDILGIPFDD